MNRQDLLDQIRSCALGHPLTWYQATDSTNTQAISAACAGQADHGAVFIAGRQTQGRGTDGNEWASSHADGLWMSLVLRSDAPMASAMTLMPAIAIAKALMQNWGVDAHLKWPNDVMVADRKIAGILVESIVQAAGLVHIIGIGVNLNQEEFKGDLATIACSARMVLDRHIPVPIFFGQLMAEIEHWWQRPSDWTATWCAMSRMVGSQVLLKRDGKQVVVKVTGLSPDGYLRVTDAQGETHEIISRVGLDVRLIEPQTNRSDQDVA